jgi:hypothetical protein
MDGRPADARVSSKLCEALMSDLQGCIILGGDLGHAVDEEIMLVDVDLNARVAAVEIEQCLGAVLYSSQRLVWR